MLDRALSKGDSTHAQSSALRGDVWGLSCGHKHCRKNNAEKQAIVSGHGKHGADLLSMVRTSRSDLRLRYVLGVLEQSQGLVSPGRRFCAPARASELRAS